nr:hypothetical protein [Kangiella shandongensis]
MCKAVTDKEIKRAACEGACSMRCLNKMGVATQCGKCARDAKQILRSTRAEIDVQPAADIGRIAIQAA